MTHQVVCTLFERDYDRGAAALINSLERAGFAGTMVCGYRGSPPSWAGQISRLKDITVQFMEMDGQDHLAYRKARILQEVIREGGSAIESVYYFDPDIVIKCPWTVLRRWAADGIALVEDVNGNVPSRHPMRLQWRDWMQAHHIPVERELDRYFNSGFIGLPPSMLRVLDLWQAIMDEAKDHLGSLNSLKNKTTDGLFFHGDQDHLNMALEACSIPLNAAGPEAMDFTHGGLLLSHAVGTPKPWQTRPLAQALHGRPPSVPHRTFLEFMGGPLAVLPTRQASRLRIETKLAGFVGRLYRRA